MIRWRLRHTSFRIVSLLGMYSINFSRSLPIRWSGRTLLGHRSGRHPRCVRDVRLRPIGPSGEENRPERKGHPARQSAAGIGGTFEHLKRHALYPSRYRAHTAQSAASGSVSGRQDPSLHFSQTLATDAGVSWFFAPLPTVESGICVLAEGWTTWTCMLSRSPQGSRRVVPVGAPSRTPNGPMARS